MTGVTSFTGPEGPFDVDVFDSATDYIKLMKYVASVSIHQILCFKYHLLVSLTESDFFFCIYEGETL